MGNVFGGLKAIGGVVDGNANPSLRLMPAIEVKSGTAAAPLSISRSKSAQRAPVISITLETTVAVDTDSRRVGRVRALPTRSQAE
jgi:hypothetical protein